MVLLEIVGMRDGVRPISITAPATEVPGLGKEFDGEIHLEGRIVKAGRRYVVSATVDAEGAFTCDRSLEKFRETISAELHLEFIIDSALAAKQVAGVVELDDEQERGIGEDDRTLDITEDVRQVLTVAIPMQHIAPQFRDVPLEDLYPTLKESRDSSELVDDRWAALQQLKRK
jgi:uncharacterized metal-binding protein YceD (DUF177 family)